MTRDELLAELKALGFQMRGTASKKWRIALCLLNETQSLVILVRTRGVDLLITPLAIDEMANSERKLSISMQRAGDRFVEYNYTESEASVHLHCDLHTWQPFQSAETQTAILPERRRILPYHRRFLP